MMPSTPTLNARLEMDAVVTKDELYALLEQDDLLREMDVKTLVLDIIRERLNPDDLLDIFWEHLGDLDEEFVKGYFYRRR